MSLSPSPPGPPSPTGSTGAAGAASAAAANASAAHQPRVVTTAAQLRTELAALRQRGRSIGLVPTMGALHRGHASLVEASSRECDFTIVTIFVNPTQFGPEEDLARYPRSLAADVALVGSLGADLVFAPDEATMYPPGYATFIEVGAVALPLEGQFRPGHFRGVATVVLKLFQLAPADVAYFGQKDYQQTLVVRQMVRDLNVPIEIRVCPIVREADGLALSSRNVYLSQRERADALTLVRSLRRASELVAGGERDSRRILDEMRSLYAPLPDATIDYLALVDPQTLSNVERVDGPTLAAVAVRIGATRLIDNLLIEPH